MIVDQKELIRRGARNFGDKKALVFKDGKGGVVDGDSLTFNEVNERANRLANALFTLGVTPGTAVAALTQNCLEYVEIEFGCIKGAFPRVILNPMLNSKEIEFQINNSKPAVLLLQNRYVEMINAMKENLSSVKYFIVFGGKEDGMMDYESLIREASQKEPEVTLDPESLGELRYTGGTTGTPKGIMLPFKSAAAVTRDILMEYLGDLTSEDRWLAIQPLFHGAGWYNLAVGVNGMTQYIVNAYHAETAMEQKKKEGITPIKRRAVSCPTH